MNAKPIVGAEAPVSNHGERITPASCTLCRRRKVKCDRSFPCGTCQRAKAECIPYTPSRAPRGRQGGRKKTRNDNELLTRLAKLEAMVKDIEDPEGASTGEREKPSIADTDMAQPLRADQNVSPPIPNVDRYMGSAFWMSLTDEINGLKDILGGSSSDDDENWNQQTPVSGSSSEKQQVLPSNHSAFAISQTIPPVETIHPTHHQIYAFCDIYLTNVDPITKVLHAPSVRMYLQENAEELNGSPGPCGLEALRFSIYYAASTSLTDEECRYKLGEDRQELLMRYRAGTESGLSKADFLNTLEMSTLQALVIYLTALRANDASRRTWTLTSVVVRIAEAMGLNIDATSVSLPPFEREMRRRLWWQIVDLDTHTSGDRASNPIIFANSFNTKLPMQISDEDMSPNSLAEIEEREGFTDMTFPLVCNEIFETIRKVNYIPELQTVELQTKQQTWSQRVEMVIQFQRHMEQSYLHRLNLHRPFHWYTRMIADIVIAIMWLLVYRPVRSHPSNSYGNQIGDPGILRLSVDVLERFQRLLTDPAGSPYKWLTQTFVQWHALAVTIAELCVKTEGPMVEKAWAIVEPAFAQTSQHVADSNKGMLWRPIKKLMSRARGVRHKYLTSLMSEAGVHENIQNSPPNLISHNTTNLNDLRQTPSEGNTYTMATSFQTLPTTTAAPFDWDMWLSATSAAAPPAPQDQYVQTGTVNPNGWANWENFIDTVQGDDNDMMDSSGAELEL